MFWNSGPSFETEQFASWRVNLLPWQVKQLTMNRYDLDMLDVNKSEMNGNEETWPNLSQIATFRYLLRKLSQWCKWSSHETSHLANPLAKHHPCSQPTSYEHLQISKPNNHTCPAQKGRGRSNQNKKPRFCYVMGDLPDAQEAQWNLSVKLPLNSHAVIHARWRMLPLRGQMAVPNVSIWVIIMFVCGSLWCRFSCPARKTQLVSAKAQPLRLSRNRPRYDRSTAKFISLSFGTCHCCCCCCCIMLIMLICSSWSFFEPTRHRIQGRYVQVIRDATWCPLLIPGATQWRGWETGFVLCADNKGG